MLHVACVRWGDAFGVEYVERLADMVRRNLPDGYPGRFVCLTDDPAALLGIPGVETQLLPMGLDGWWNKLALFQPGAFPQGDKVLFFDLDTVIASALDPLVAFDAAFAVLEDFYRGPGTIQSAVMLWRAGTTLATSIWEEFCARLGPGLENDPAALWPGGDQEFLEHFWAREGYLEQRMAREGHPGQCWPPEFLQQHLPGFFRSYKVSCQDGIPKGCSVVVFHGRPRPHEVTEGWVPQLWKVGGGSSAQFVVAPTIEPAQMLENVRTNMRAGYEELDLQTQPNDLTAVICGGAPSLKGCLSLLANLQMSGAVVFTVNGVEGYLREHGLQGNIHVMVDGRPQMAEMIRPGGLKLYASMMDPKVLLIGKRLGDRLCMWHSHIDGIQAAIPQGAPVIAGGETVGIRALLLAYTMGFRRIVVMGFDSSYAEGSHHAYPQALNDGERVLDVLHKGKAFKAAPWMVRQAESFVEIASSLAEQGCAITLFGGGLLQHMMAHVEPPAIEQRAAAILNRLPDGPVQGVEVGVFAGDLSRRLLRRENLKLYMVDSWSGDHKPAYKLSGDFHAQLSQHQQDGFYERTCEAVKFAKARAVILRKDSIAASIAFPDASLDFVFIDADHSYEGCRADILAWRKKVRPGGVLCGHDYAHPDLPGVRQAVDELIQADELELGANFTWFTRVA